MSDKRDSDILEWWRDFSCNHVVQAAGMYGHIVNFSCNLCGRTCMFKYKPESDSFEAIAGQGNTHNIMDDISVRNLSTFLKGIVPVFFIPDPPGDPYGYDPIGDEMRFRETVNVFLKQGLDVFDNGHKVSSENTTTKCCNCGHEHNH